MNVNAFIIEREEETNVFSFPASYAFWVFYVEMQVSFFVSMVFLTSVKGV